jgi:hypothetical protein
MTSDLLKPCLGHGVATAVLALDLIARSLLVKPILGDLCG